MRGGRFSKHHARAPLLVLGALVLLLALARAGAWHMFSGFMPYDDEGLLLVQLRDVADGGDLYDTIYTQYGPAYFLIFDALFGLLGLTVDHDTGRIVTLVGWLTAAALYGAGVTRACGSWAAGALSAIGSFLCLEVMVAEPMHPGGLLAVLLAGLFVVVAGGGGSRALIAAGALAGLMAMIKVNVGGFAVLGLIAGIGLACTLRPLAAAATAGLVLVPLGLMASRIGEPGVVRYAAVVVLAALAAGLAAPGGRGPWRRTLLVAVGAAGAAAAVGAVHLVRHPGVGDLLDGVLLGPMRHPDAFFVALDVPLPALILALVSAAAAAAVRVRPALRADSRGLSALSIGAGALMVCGVSNIVPQVAEALGPRAIGGVLVLSWVLLVSGGPEPSRPDGAVRALLVAVAILQGLHAYPVAGAQIAWSVVTCVAIGAICITDGVAMAARVSPIRAREATAVAAGVALVLAAGTANRVAGWREEYAAGVELGLPGADLVRAQAPVVSAQRRLAEVLPRRCSAFVSLPGLNSLYLFSRMAPPTSTNATAWPWLWEDEEQRRVVDALDAAPRPCIVRNDRLLAFWGQGRPVPEGPLVELIREDFVPAERVGDYELLVRRG